MPGKIRLRNACFGLWVPLVLVFAASFGFGAGRLASARENVPSLVPLLNSGTTIVGEPITYPKGAPAKITATIVTLQAGQESGWHRHGIPAFGYLLEGELTVDYGDKGVRTYNAGDAVLEAIQHPHNVRNTGPGPMRILAVFMGAEGLPTTVPVAR